MDQLATVDQSKGKRLNDLGKTHAIVVYRTTLFEYARQWI